MCSEAWYVFGQTELQTDVQYVCLIHVYVGYTVDKA